MSARYRRAGHTGDHLDLRPACARFVFGGRMKSVNGTTKALAALIAFGAFIPAKVARADILPAVGAPTVSAVAGGFN